MPATTPRSGAAYDTGWARGLPARVGRSIVLEALLRPTIAGLARPERQGLDRLVELAESGSPAIFAANHHSHIDTPVVLTSIPEPWRHRMFVGAAADYFFRNQATSAAAALALNAIPIDRTTVTRRSADQAAELVEDGWSMLIFPEGGRSPDGYGQQFRAGAAYLARRCDVPVVPMYLAGTGRVLRKGRSRISRSPVTVNFGSPLRCAAGEDTRSLNRRIEAAVAVLGDEVTVGFYEARRRAHAGETTSRTGLAGVATWRRQWALGRRGPIRPEERPWPRL